MSPDPKSPPAYDRTGLWLVLGLALILLSAKNAKGSDGEGEFGGDFQLLASAYSGPRMQGESNYFIDMWEGQTLRSVVSINGLTNNHALFVNCHGKRLASGRFAFYPHQNLIPTGTEAPCYSSGDFAALIGEADAAGIHNIVLAACNAEGALTGKELRKFFPNATNIIRCPAGELGYQPMFLQAIVNSSWNIKPIYEWRERNFKGDFEYVTGYSSTAGAKRFAPYLVEMFKPGAIEPFCVQRAGREVLEPQRFSTVAGRPSPGTNASTSAGTPAP